MLQPPRRSLQALPTEDANTIAGLRHRGDQSCQLDLEPVVVTRNGRARNVLISMEEYERLKKRDQEAFRAADKPAELLADIEALAWLADIEALARDDGR